MNEILVEVLKVRKEVAELKAILHGMTITKPTLFSINDDIGIEEKISLFLHELRLPSKLLGYTYLREAIKEVYEDPDLIGAFTTVLYPKIANKFETKPNRVERAIRHAIEVSWNKNSLHSFYSANFNSRPTNSEFISIIADEFFMKDKYKTEVV